MTQPRATVELAAQLCGTTAFDLFAAHGGNRGNKWASERHLVWWLVRRAPMVDGAYYSYPDISDACGRRRRNHATICEAMAKLAAYPGPENPYTRILTDAWTIARVTGRVRQPLTHVECRWCVQALRKARPTDG